MSEIASSSTSPGSNNTHIIIAVIVAILILFILFGTCTETGKQTFENIKNKLRPSANMKDLDVVMFMSPTCPHCIKMLDILEKEKQLNNVTIIDVTKKEGLEFAKQFGADKQPVPSFISRKLKSATVGSKDSLADLVKDLTLKKPEPSSEEPSAQTHTGNSEFDTELIKKLQIILFAREGCSHCTNAKDSCAKSGIMDLIKVVDITTPEGQEMAAELIPNASGVPSWVSLATKKSVIGNRSLNEIIQELQ
jgi:glutaredoxin